MLPGDDRATRHVLLVCRAAGATTLLDQAVLNIAVPSMRHSLGAGAADMQWIVAGCSLAFGLALVPGGGLGDLHGRKRLFLVGMAVFLLAGVAAATGCGPGTVIGARLVQGSLLGLTEPDAGTVWFDGVPWTGVPERARRPLRHRVQAVQQDPLGSFDPRFDVERVIGEAVALAGPRHGRARRARVAELLDQVGLSASVLDRRPRDLSGGQRQRVAIARALAPAPDVIVCDEPVSALDVSVQAQILDLLADLRHDTGVTLLFISHDLGVVHHVSDRVLVMRDGRVIESGDVEAVFTSPKEDCTRELLAAAVPGAPRSDDGPPTADSA